MSLPKTLTPQYLAERWPVVYHVTDTRAVQMIDQYGLLSVRALLDLFGVRGAERRRIERGYRTDRVRLTHPDIGEAWINDNRPTNLTVLRRTLRGMTEEEWFSELNSKVFFWLNTMRVDTFLKRRRKLENPLTLYVFDTALLLKKAGNRLRLSAVNSGAVHGAGVTPRGVGTFTSIDDYPWRERCFYSHHDLIAEMTIEYSLSEVKNCLVRSERL